jgi:hypothetical protein
MEIVQSCRENHMAVIKTDCIVDKDVDEAAGHLKKKDRLF